MGAAPEQLLAIAAGHGLEGLVCKRAASLYQPGRRTRAWIKTVLARSTEVTVIGCVRGRARHPDGVGALLVAVPDQDGRLRYAGQVETGWTRDEHTELVAALARLGTDRCPLPDTSAPVVAGTRWTLPELTGRVQFRHYTRAGLLRHPSWKGLLLRESGRGRGAPRPRRRSRQARRRSYGVWRWVAGALVVSAGLPAIEYLAEHQRFSQ